MNASSLWTAFICLFAMPCAVAGPTWREPVSGIDLVKIPAGCFSMGAVQAGQRTEGLWFVVPASDEVPRHEVCVDAFWLGRTEVTREQWHRIMTPGAGGGAVGPLKDADRPMVEVSWDDALRFVEQLNRVARDRYRLPTESEWEYACHAGTSAAAAQPQGEALVSLDTATKRLAWYADSSRPDPHTEAVGQKAANAWGLFDMLGNVWEWTADSYRKDGYVRHAANNPVVVINGAPKVIRGGSYRSNLLITRCGARNFFPGDGRMPVIGLRVVKDSNGHE